MGQIVTTNKPSDLEKLAGVFQGAGSAAWGMTDAKQLLEELAQEKEAHKLDVAAALQYAREGRRRSEREFEKHEWQREDQEAQMGQRKLVGEEDVAQKESAYRTNRAILGDDDPDAPDLPPSIQADLDAAIEMARYMPASEQPRFSAFLSEFLKEKEQANQVQALGETIKKASQPDPLSGEPAMDEATAAKLQGLLEAGEDPAKVTDLAHTHLKAVAKERAETMQYTGALTRMQQRYEQMQADPLADPDMLDAMADEIAIMQVYKPTGAALRESERRFLGTSRGKSQQQNGGKEKSPFEMRTKAVELAQKDPDWAGTPTGETGPDGEPVMKQSKDKAEIVRAYMQFLETGELPKSGGAEQAPGSQAGAVSPGESPAAPSTGTNGYSFGQGKFQKADPGATGSTPEQAQQTAAESAEALIAAAKRAALGKSPEEAEKIKEAARKAYEAMTKPPGDEPKKKTLRSRKREDAPGRNQ